jgi:8-amino-7-oxononanoate synthase
VSNRQWYTGGQIGYAHPEVVAASIKATEEFGTGTTGSRLLIGTYSLHVALEEKIANWLGHDDAVVFTTGYQTNVGTIQGLIGRDCLAVVDSYAHASIRDGVRLSGAVEERFDHNDVSSLCAVLKRHAGTTFRRNSLTRLRPAAAAAGSCTLPGARTTRVRSMSP